MIYSALQKYMQPKTERGVAQIVEVLRRVSEKAAASDIMVGVEVVNRYETNICNTAAECVALLDLINLPNVKAHIDTYHMNIEDGFLSGAIEQCGDRIGYFHVGESHRGYLGTGTVDFTAVFRSLARIGYDGPIAFESFSSAVVDPMLSNMLGVWRNLWSDSYDLARHAKAFMEAQRAGRRIRGEARIERALCPSWGSTSAPRRSRPCWSTASSACSPRPRCRLRSRVRTRSGRSRRPMPGGQRPGKRLPGCAPAHRRVRGNTSGRLVGPDARCRGARRCAIGPCDRRSCGTMPAPRPSASC